MWLGFCDWRCCCSRGSCQSTRATPVQAGIACLQGRYISISKSGDGLIDVLKVIHFNKLVSAQIASSLCRGEGFAPVFRPGPWAVKKAFPWLLKRISGYRGRWNTPEERLAESLRMSQSQTTWSTDNESFSEGIRFINEHAPECDACNMSKPIGF